MLANFFYELITTQKDLATKLELYLLILIISFIVVISKESTVKTITNKRNFAVFFYLLLVTSIVILFDLILGNLYPKSMLMIRVLIIISYLVVCCSLNQAFLSHMTIKKYYSFLVQDKTIEYQIITQKKPFYFLLKIDSIEYHWLCAAYLKALNEPFKAYSELEEINPELLPAWSNEKLIIKKISLLIQLGAFDRAKKQAELLQNADKNPAILILLSSIEEMAGNIKKAFEILNNAQLCLSMNSNKKNVCSRFLFSKISDINDAELHSAVLNNFGRMYKIVNNQNEAVRWYQKALQCALDGNVDTAALHVPYQNLIFQTLSCDSKNPEVDKLCLEYKSKVAENPTLSNKIEFYNFWLCFLRETKKLNESFDFINTTYNDLLKCITSKKEKYALEISTFRMLCHGRLSLDLVKHDMQEDFEDYFKIDGPEKLYILKELYQQIASTNLIVYTPFNYFYMKIRRYYLNDALSDIDKYLKTLNFAQRYEECKLLEEKIFIIKMSGYCFDLILQIMENIIKVYKDSELYIDKILACLNIADECIDLHNININTKQTKYHDKMTYYLDLAMNDMQTLESHQCLIEMNLRAAYYLFHLNRKEESRKYLSRYEATKYSVNHFAPWLQAYYYDLKKTFSN